MLRILVAATLVLSSVPSAADIVIREDRGGRLAEYLQRYAALRDTKERVKIDGLCASGCTLVLGYLPPARVCATPRAVLRFHAAYALRPSGLPYIGAAPTARMLAIYWQPVRRWIRRQGGLTLHSITLQGQELQAIVRACP